MQQNKPSLAATLFSQYLIPAGQLAELVVGATVKQGRQVLSQTLFEPLGLVAAFSCRTERPLTQDEIIGLADELQNAIDLMVDALAPLTDFALASGSMACDLRTRINALPAKIAPALDQMMKIIGYHPAQQRAWMEDIMRDPSALLETGSFGRWRTLVRHIDVDSNMRNYSLSNAAKTHIPPKGGNAHTAALDLWERTFGSMAGTAIDTRDRPLFPQRAQIKANPSGLIEVSMDFDPRIVLQKVLAPMKDLPAGMLDEDLAGAVFRNEYDYTQIPAAVEELRRWERTQAQKAERTAGRLLDWAESVRVDDLRKRLEAGLSEEDRALLPKMLNAVAEQEKTNPTNRKHAAR